MLTAIVGINWGDEGKGRMVDLLCADYDIVCRYQGGNNAGHTVVNSKGEFVLNLIPSGISRDGTVNVMGNGMVIDLQHLCQEIQSLRDKGITITPANLKISDKAIICLPYHKMLDILEEERLADHKYGSTRRGIGPVYGDKYMKKGLRMEDLLFPDTLEEKVRDLVAWKNITIVGYKKPPIDADEILSWLKTYGNQIVPHISDIRSFLSAASAEGKNILFEAQLGALRDIDFGIYPYTSSSQTLAAFAPIGAGIPGARLDNVIGIMKAYSTCVGEGPFTAEMFGAEADCLRSAGGEYGAATGRPRRVGPFDVPASRYGVCVQGADCLALTKLDVLSYLDRIPVCTSYKIDGVQTSDFPTGDRLLRAEPVIEYLPGFGDVSGCRTWQSLPQAARDYVQYLQSAVNCPIRYISVGPGREEYIRLD